MGEKKGITVMMLGFWIGLILVVVFIIFVFMFYESDLFGGLLKGIRDAVSSWFMAPGGQPGP